MTIDYGSRSIAAIMVELLKCQVLCREHHVGPNGKHGKNGNGTDVIPEQLPLFVVDPEYRSGPWKTT